MKIHKFLLYSLIIFASIGLWTSCTYETLPLPEVPDEVGFSDDIMPVFNTSCNVTGCHSQGAVPPQLTQDVAWANLIYGGFVDTVNVQGSRLLQKITPPGSMAKYATEKDRALIEAWIEQGAKEN